MEHSSKVTWMVSIFDVVISLVLVAAYAWFVLEGQGPAVVIYFKYGLPGFFIAILIKLWAAHLLHQSSKLEMIAIAPYDPLYKVRIWLIVSFLFVIVELAIGIWVRDFTVWLPMSGFIASHMIFLVLIIPFALALQKRIAVCELPNVEVGPSVIMPGQPAIDSSFVKNTDTVLELFLNLEGNSVTSC